MELHLDSFDSLDARFEQTLQTLRGPDLFMEWVDEIIQFHEEQEAVLRDVAARGLTPPKADNTPVTIRWACLKPTDERN